MSWWGSVYWYEFAGCHVHGKRHAVDPQQRTVWCVGLVQGPEWQIWPLYDVSRRLLLPHAAETETVR